jgi:hypothetical protein
VSLWPNQVRFVDGGLAAITRRPAARPLLSSPTGTGKSRAMCVLIERLVEEGYYVVLYSNRNLLVEQLQEVLAAHGIDFGVRARGHDDDEDFWPVQISSLPTETSRVLKRGTWSIHGKGRRKCAALVDEAHLNRGPKACEIFAKHTAEGHAVVGVTATPIGLADVYDELIVCGTLAEGREVGALALAEMYAPDEPDWRAFRKAMNKKAGGGEGDQGDALGITEPAARRVMGQVTDDGPDRLLSCLYGRVWKHFNLINPERRPSILFAPGVNESVWFAEQFTAKGVRAAHIDGESVWVDGEFHPTSKTLRRQVLDDSKAGRIGVICNRFVLREGIDAPWLDHGIAATVFGSLQTFLQSAGRLLRAPVAPAGHVAGPRRQRLAVRVDQRRPGMVPGPERSGRLSPAGRADPRGRRGAPVPVPEVQPRLAGQGPGLLAQARRLRVRARGQGAAQPHGGHHRRRAPQDRGPDLRAAADVHGPVRVVPQRRPRRANRRVRWPAGVRVLLSRPRSEALGADVLPRLHPAVERHLQSGDRHVRP